MFCCFWPYQSVLYPENEVIKPGLPGRVEQRVPGSHQLPDVHGDVAELVAEQAAQAHEGRGISDDLLRVRHHFGPVGRPRAGEQAQRPASSAGQSPAGQAAPGKQRHFAARLF